MTQPDLTSRLDFLYLLSGLVYAASLLYIGMLRWLAKRAEIQAYVQFIGDLLLITGLVYYFGGLASPFSIFYFIVVIVAATLLGRRPALGIAACAWVFYAAIVLALAYRLLDLPGGVPAETPSRLQLTYNLGVHLLGFFVVALLTSRWPQSVAQAESALRRKGEQVADLEVFHRDIIESIPSGLVTTDLEGRVTSANRAAEQILGVGAQALGGRPIYDTGFLTSDQWHGLAEHRFHRAPDPARADLPAPARRAASSAIALTHLTNAEGTPLGLHPDLPGPHRLAKAAGGAAHQGPHGGGRRDGRRPRARDRQPAGGDLRLGADAGRQLRGPAGADQAAGDHPQGEPAARPHDQELPPVRPPQGSHQRAASTSPRCWPRTSSCCATAPRSAEQHWLELELDPASVTLEADPDQISQIFWNLARNALRAMPDGGRLTIVGRVQGEIYRIAFSDTGRGMDDDERARLFQPFQSFFDGGTGIGMAIVYRIVEEHGGRLTVDSEPGSGSTITVELPLPGAAAAGPAA